MIIDELAGIAHDPRKSVDEHIARTGKKAIGCFPVYSPEELVYAAGMLPVGMWGGQTDISKATQYLQSFCCSIMKANLENGLNGVYDALSMAIIPTFCDTLKCMGEVWKTAVPKPECFTFVFPQNRKLEAGVDFMRSELERLRARLEGISGAKIGDGDIERAIAVYDEYRAAARDFVKTSPSYPLTVNARVRHNVLKAAFFMDKAEYAAKLRAATAELKALPPEDGGSRGVVLTGLLAEPDGFLDLFADSRLHVAADDLVQESKQFRVDAPKEGASPLDRLARRLSDMDGCSLLYDSARTRGQKILGMVKDTGAAGVVVCMMKFCDPEEFDYPIYKKELEKAGVPLLYLEIEQKMDSAEQLRTRIQTFAEMLGA
ncbi:MAG: 2-hydroxyacyl-CoA dehydratase family protein [Clostridiales Family XIII bacterium]|jgi:benzoyl-CoA reductase/2-hydroxyglutaryl-CoA dehydratase subunit BcrC/BadD/HgdB|nr:2-hydroxyacyl-CoA dehydratase family protein [Clostridiales Family XIII bacterium]